jgi:Macrophage killing protein with similarity to conjugation protein.
MSANIGSVIEARLEQADFYRRWFPKVVMGNIVQFFLIIVLVVAVTILALRPREADYFATSADGSIVRLVPLKEPLVNDAKAAQLAVDAITKAYTFDFYNYRVQRQEAAQYFTDAGWAEFDEKFMNTGILDIVTKHGLVATPIISAAPVIPNKGIQGGRYSWLVQFPLLVTLQSASEQAQQAFNVSALVVRDSNLERPSGIVIQQVIIQRRVQ